MPEFTSPFMASAPPRTAPDNHIIARAVRFQIAAELEAVNQYDELLRECSDPVIIEVIRGILLDEKEHIGELLELLFHISPIDRSLAADGVSEVSEILVRQMMAESSPSNS